MNTKTALLGLALLVPTTTLYSADAAAFAKCDKMEDDKKKAKCEKSETKRIAKLRKKTTPFKPSAISDSFAALDGDDANPFNTDDYYLGISETGIKPLDELVASVVRIQGAVALATYVGALDKDGKSDEAKALATDLLPELLKMKDEVEAIKEKVNEIKADPTSLVKDNPAAALKVPGALGPVATQLPKTIGQLPKAIAALKPLAGGAMGAAVKAAAAKAGEAAGGAMGKAADLQEAAQGAAEAAGDASKAAERIQEAVEGN